MFLCFREVSVWGKACETRRVVHTQCGSGWASCGYKFVLRGRHNNHNTCGQVCLRWFGVLRLGMAGVWHCCVSDIANCGAVIATVSFDAIFAAVSACEMLRGRCDIWIYVFSSGHVSTGMACHLAWQAVLHTSQRGAAKYINIFTNWARGSYIYR